MIFALGCVVIPVGQYDSLVLPVGKGEKST